MSSCGDGRRDGECEEESGGPEGWQGEHFVEQEGSQRKLLRRILGGGVVEVSGKGPYGLSSSLGEGCALG